MTEKRFWYDFEDCTGAKIVDFMNDKEYPLETIGDFREIEKLLNALHEENQSLRAFIKQLTNDCGEIVLMNGTAYNVKKALGDLE